MVGAGERGHYCIANGARSRVEVHPRKCFFMWRMGKSASCVVGHAFPGMVLGWMEKWAFSHFLGSGAVVAVLGVMGALLGLTTVVTCTGRYGRASSFLYAHGSHFICFLSRGDASHNEIQRASFLAESAFTIADLFIWLHIVHSY